MRKSEAEALAIEALGWLAGQPEALGRFLADAGAGPGELRALAAEPAFLGFVIDFLLSDEPLLLAFCAERGVPPETPMRARAALPGGDIPHWT
jgi:hypothetical protein